MAGKTVEAARFSMVPRVDVPRSAFTVEHSHKTTFDAGFLVPIYVDEILPGDSVQLRMSAFARLAPPITPVMDNLYLESFFFFVPSRLLWDNWLRFMGERLNLADSTIFLVPQVELDAPAAFAVSSGVPSLADFFGLTMNGAGAGTISVSCLPFRAYNLIYNEWFRDQDVIDPAIQNTGDGPDNWLDYTVRRRGKRHDYFTSCRPWPEKPIFGSLTSEFDPLSPGGAFTLLPGAAGAPVTGLGVLTAQAATAGPITVDETGSRTNVYDKYHLGSSLRMRAGASLADAPDVRVLVNDIRTANTIQLLMERNARGGTRYTELIRSHFGVMSPDARLQRPEYLGGGRTPVTVNPVLQTSASGLTGGTTVLGELAGVGTALVQDHGFSASFVEHGYVIGLVNVRADLTYQQGNRRMWYRRTQYDFYWPALAHLGEQAVLSKEIFCDGTAGDEDVFGYQERWAEYKYHPSRTSGRFRSSSAGTLDIWHFGEEFGSRPTLDPIFATERPPVDRVLQVGGSDNEQFLLDTFFTARMVRCMPLYSIPGIGGRL